MPEDTVPAPGPIGAPTLFPEEAEIAELHALLAENEKFRLCRGNLSDWFSIENLLNDSPTKEKPEGRQLDPDQVLDRIRQRMGHAKPMLNLLATLRRDGKLHAFAELHSALKMRDYVMLGEVPLTDRVRGTLMIPDAENVLRLLRWTWVLHPLQIAAHLGYTKGSRLGREWFPCRERPELKHLTDEIMESYPALLARFHDVLGTDEDNGGLRWRRYPDNQGNWFCQYFDEDTGIDFCEGRAHVDKYLDRGVCSLRNAGYTERGLGSDHVALYAGMTFAYFYEGLTPGEVARKFSRAQQSRMALLSFEYPTVDLYNQTSARIGLFPADEHEQFRKIWPSWVSHGTTHGIGAVVMPSRRAQRWASYRDDEGHRAAFQIGRYYEQAETPDPMRARMLLAFGSHE